MNIGFYAPLKSPTSPTPSGDRLIGRLLIQALEHCGHNVDLISTFRSFDRDGNPHRQQRLKRLGRQIADQVIRRKGTDKLDLWFTYHLYHKAPDWLGPKIAKKLAIPYVVAEASFAPKQQAGPWASGHAAVGAALAQTRLVIGLTKTDRACVLPRLSDNAQYKQLPPFLDSAPFAAAAAHGCAHRRKLIGEHGLNGEVPWLLSVAMMRPGDKTESYAMLAEALGSIANKQWQLLVVGEGPELAHIQSLFAPLQDRVRWLGRQSADGLAGAYAASDIFVWPAVKETPGMCFLEAGAAGLPVVGGNGYGVPDVIRDGETGLLADHLSVTDFANKVSVLIDDEKMRRDMGLCAFDHVRNRHDIRTAGKVLDEALGALVR